MLSERPLAAVPNSRRDVGRASATLQDALAVLRDNARLAPLWEAEAKRLRGQLGRFDEFFTAICLHCPELRDEFVRLADEHGLRGVYPPAEEVPERTE